jgi:hypothetical protein
VPPTAKRGRRTEGRKAVHTPLEFYLKLPQDLYRAGRKNKARLDYIRTMPPRTKDETWDMKIFERGGQTFVDSKSGGLSLFNFRNPQFGPFWWKIPKGTPLPADLHISLDDTPRKAHFTVRPLVDMRLDVFLGKLRELEVMAVPCFLDERNSEAI